MTKQEAWQEYYSNNRESILAKKKLYKAAHKHKVAETLKTWRTNNKVKRQDYQLQYTHGITLNRYQEILASQEGVCAICGDPPGKTAFHVDHDHLCCPGKKSCGKCTRGLLCRLCNTILGLVKDRPLVLVLAAFYLEKEPDLKKLIDAMKEAQKQMEKHSGQIVPKDAPKKGKKSCCF